MKWYSITYKQTQLIQKVIQKEVSFLSVSKVSNALIQKDSND